MDMLILRKRLGSTPLLYDLALVKGDSFRFSYQNATGKIGRTFSINLFILIVFMVATWYFMISNYCLTQRS